MSLRSLVLPAFVLSACVLLPACDDDQPTGYDSDTGGLGDLSAVADMKGADQGVPDLSLVGPSGMIQKVRDQADSMPTADGGMLAMSLPVHDVYVTGLRPVVAGSTVDPPGFFVQAEAMGPALFVAVDPSSLSPVPALGDLVRFDVTSVSTVSGTRQAGSITTWSVVSSGFDTAVLVKDVTASADLVTALESYESELIKITSATISSAFASSAGGYVAATITTAGINFSSSGFKLRVPVTLRDSLGLDNGCVVAIGPSPLWRFNAVAEPSAWSAGELTVTSCPTPRVVSATATNATSVLVSFDRPIAAASLLADGSQFSFTSASGAITASAAMIAAANQVKVTTNAQTGNVAYTVAVAATLKDSTGNGVDPAHNSANFAGYVTPAVVTVNEVGPNLSGSLDMVELKVITAGSLASLSLYQDITAANRKLLSALPALDVVAGNLVVVHLSTAAAVFTTETNVGGKAGCANAACYANAWDVASTTTTPITNSSRFVTVFRADDTIMDTLAFSTSSLAAFNTEMKAAQTANAWLGVCPNACAAAADAITIAVSTAANGGIATTVVGNSIQRSNDTVPSQATDWTIKASTWGAAN